MSETERNVPRSAWVGRPSQRDRSSGWVELNRDGRLRAVSEGARSLLGISSEETAVGRPADRVLLDPVVETGVTETTDEDGEECRVTVEGRQRRLLVRSRDVTDGGRLVARLLVVSDATADDSGMERSQDGALERRVEAVSHDLRSPLDAGSTRLSLLEQALESADIDKEVRARVDDHLEAAKRSFERADELRDELADATDETDPVETDPVVLRRVARDAWETVDTGDLTLRIRSSRPLEADAAGLSRLFENCFRNVVDHADAGTVRVGATGDGFFVADDGVGIPQKRRKTVLQRGYSTAPGGDGIGLAVVSEVAADHGWEVEITGSEDGGTRVDLRTSVS